MKGDVDNGGRLCVCGDKGHISVSFPQFPSEPKTLYLSISLFLSVSFPQFCSEPKTALKSNLFGKKEKSMPKTYCTVVF